MTQKSLADEVALHWLSSDRMMPTRALQLAFEKAHASYGQMSDMAIVLAILKNSPSAVPPDLVEHVEYINTLIESEMAVRVANRNRVTGNKYAETIGLIRRDLSKYLLEKGHGLHQYATTEDCSLDLISHWAQQRARQKPWMQNRGPDEITVLGHSDYLRLAARGIQKLPGPVWQSRHSSKDSTLLASLRGSAIDQKKAAKLLKRLAKQAHLSDAAVPEHQDMVLMLTENKIRIRPASFTQEAWWAIGSDGSPAFGSIHNLLEKRSPVHDTGDAILEFEDLLNTTSASEADFHRFFELNPRFLLGTDYSSLVSHPVLVREDEHNLVPDFIMIPHNFSRPAVLDLKLPRRSRSSSLALNFV